jgi:hypothetical protein
MSPDIERDNVGDSAMMKLNALMLALAGACAVAAADEEVTITQTAGLDIRLGKLARLTPDGRHVLFLKRKQDKTHAYWLVGADGKGERKLFDSAIQWDDLFTCCFGRGIFSPNGKRLAALTTDSGKGIRDGGRPAVVICDRDGKATPVPCAHGATWSAVFADDDTVYYVDSTPPKSRKPRSELKRMSLKTRAVTTVAKFDDALLAALTLSADRRRIAAVHVADERPRIWAMDLASSVQRKSPVVGLNDYFFDGGPWLFWSADGTSLLANASANPEKKRPFSIVQYRPRLKAGAKAGKDELRVLQKDKSLVTLCELAPGRLSAASERPRASFVVDVEADAATPMAPPLLLVDRRGEVGLFADLTRGRLCVGTIAGKQPPGREGP